MSDKSNHPAFGNRRPQGEVDQTADSVPVAA